MLMLVPTTDVAKDFFAAISLLPSATLNKFTLRLVLNCKTAK